MPYTSNPQWQAWSENQVLHVISVYANPLRSHNRLRAFQNFAVHMQATANVQMHVVEVAFGERPFEVTNEHDASALQLRTNDILWHKESAINLAVAKLSTGWKYAGYVDGDFHFTRHDWALETIHQLQHYDWVQPFSGYAFMDPQGRPVWSRPSFAYALSHGKPAQPPPSLEPTYGGPATGAVGGAWAWTRNSFEACGGMLDICVLGSADWFMAFGLVGKPTDDRDEIARCAPNYVRRIIDWQHRSYQSVRGNIGYVDNFVLHEWHGDIRKRGYEERWRILADNKFDPIVDLATESSGLIKWSGDKPRLRDQTRRYFLDRDDDDTHCTYRAEY